jgi:hypothetical protein
MVQPSCEAFRDHVRPTLQRRDTFTTTPLYALCAWYTAPAHRDCCDRVPLALRRGVPLHEEHIMRSCLGRNRFLERVRRPVADGMLSPMWALELEVAARGR